MHINHSLRLLRGIAFTAAVSMLLGGCHDEDHSKPDLNDVITALHERYGECPLWRLGDVRRIDGAPNPAGYEIAYSFVLTLKDPEVLTGHGANVVGEDAQHIAAATMGNISDPCFYGVFPLAVAISQEQPPLLHSYQGNGDRIFVQSEQGWHLNTSPPDPRDPAIYDQFAAIDDATAASLPASSAGVDPDALAGQGNIFHRLNQFLAALLHGGAHSDEPAKAGALGSTSASSEAPATGRATDSVASSSAGTHAGSSAAPAPDDASTVAPAIDTGTPMPTQGIASAGQDTATPPAPTLPATQPSVARPLAVADLEGDWQGTYQCGPYLGSGLVPNPDAWTVQVTMTVHNGQATLVRQSGGETPFREVLAGNVLPDLSLPLTGTGQNVGVEHPWYADFMGRFGGSAGAATFQANGTLSDWHRNESRACRLALGR